MEGNVRVPMNLHWVNCLLRPPSRWASKAHRVTGTIQQTHCEPSSGTNVPLLGKTRGDLFSTVLKQDVNENVVVEQRKCRCKVAAHWVRHCTSHHIELDDTCLVYLATRNLQSHIAIFLSLSSDWAHFQFPSFSSRGYYGLMVVVACMYGLTLWEQLWRVNHRSIYASDQSLKLPS